MAAVLVAAAPAIPDVSTTTAYRSARIDGVTVSHREAGPANAPTIVLLHGYPSSSRMWGTLTDILDAGHFAREEQTEEMAKPTRDFLARQNL